MTDPRPRQYLSYEQVHNIISSLGAPVAAFRPDFILAIGGGGFIPARMLRTVVNVPVLAISLELYGGAASPATTAGSEVRRLQWLDSASEHSVTGKRVLIVDEVDDTRTTLAFCCDEVLRTCAPAALAVAVVHNKARPKRCELPPNVLYLAGETVPGDCWLCYPWDAAAYGLTIAEHSALAARGAPEPKAPIQEEGLAPPTAARRHTFRGTFMHAPDRGSGLEVLEDALVVVAPGGEIEAVLRADDPAHAAAAAAAAGLGALTVLPPHHRFLPGFVDLHVHAPQWGQLGRALDLPLEEWLQAYTFPLEARFADAGYAEEVYPQLVGALLANGTTTAVYYASLHLPATRVLAETCLRLGQRALVGKVAMDDPVQCPAYYRDASAAAAVAETRALIEHVRALPGNAALPRVLPAITPRFIPSCTDSLLEGLGALAAETGCHVQTHCSESDWEHEFALGRFGCTDTEALDRFGLLSRRSILGHGNFVTDADADTIVARGATIAHCPLSNISFSGSVFPLRRLLDRGVRVGLGTDIAGGASPSLLENARMALLLSLQVEAGVHPHVPRGERSTAGARIDPATALWLATAGAGEALDLPVQIGAFRPGFRFDAIEIAGNRRGSNLQLGATGGDAAARRDSPGDELQKILYHAVRDDIIGVWVDGCRVGGRGLLSAAQ